MLLSEFEEVGLGLCKTVGIEVTKRRHNSHVIRGKHVNTPDNLLLNRHTTTTY